MMDEKEYQSQRMRQERGGTLVTGDRMGGTGGTVVSPIGVIIGAAIGDDFPLSSGDVCTPICPI